MLKGIDISNWQMGIKPSFFNIDFCICKATEGNNFVDKCCDGFISDCKKHEILWGFYHFANANDPVEECDFFIKHTKGYHGKGIPVLDYEVWGQNDNDIAWCEKFLLRYHARLGVYPLLYISASHCPDFRGSWIPEKCGLWVAGYPADYSAWPENTDIPYNVAPWAFAAIWQFTSGLNLYGNTLDGDFAYMDTKAWGKYASPANAGNQETTIKAKTCEQLANEVLAGKWGSGKDRENKLNNAYGVGTYEHVQAIVNRKLGE